VFVLKTTLFEPRTSIEKYLERDPSELSETETTTRFDRDDPELCTLH
jgi:hypothetical protein